MSELGEALSSFVPVRCVGEGGEWDGGNLLMRKESCECTPHLNPSEGVWSLYMCMHGKCICSWMAMGGEQSGVYSAFFLSLIKKIIVKKKFNKIVCLIILQSTQ